jgi:tetratricopeptide (TPR) repeat protein
MRIVDSLILALLVCSLSGCSKECKVTTHSEQALRSYEEGVALWQKFYYNEAKGAFEQALDADSTFAMAWGRLALVNAGTQNEPQAKVDITRAIQYSPAVTKKEQLFLRMWDHDINYRYKAAASVADSIIALYPKEPEAYLFRGMLYEVNKNFDASIRVYRQAVELDSAYAIAVMNLGYAYSNLGEHDKALAYMERYIRIAPEAADPRASYADLLLRIGRYDEAMQQYRKSLELKPDYWYALVKIGEIYAILGRLGEAKKEYHQGFDALPQSEQIKVSHLSADAGLNMQRGKYSEALRQYSEALDIDSTSGSAIYGVVQARIKLRDFKNVDQLVERIKQLLETRNLTESQAMLGYYLMKARLFTAQDKLREALAACDDALEYSSAVNRGIVYRQIAEIRLKENSFEAAFDACEEALRPNPNFPDALLTLAKIYHAKGDKRMTSEIGKRLLDLWRDADPDFQSLIELRQLMGIPS